MEPQKIFHLDKQPDLRGLHDLRREKGSNVNDININCQYKDFTFEINLGNVKSDQEQDTKIVKTIISKPTNLQLNGKSCNAVEKDDKNTITIVENGQELQFKNFTFEKLPFVVDNNEEIDTSEKTIFDNIVETGITEAFGYIHFDTNSKNKIEYNFPLHYNANGIFKIPVKENNEPKEITINDKKYKIDEQSAILFKKGEGTSIPYIVIDVAGNDKRRRYFNIKNSSVQNIQALDYANAEEMEIEYTGNIDFVDSESEKKDPLNFFRNLCCCCCNKTNNNNKAEVNFKILNDFKNIKSINEI